MESDEKGPEAVDWFGDLRVFVYGTLKPGGFYWNQFCEGKVANWRRARLRGEIYHLPAGYPAVCLKGQGWVYGVVLELIDADALAGLDHLEGFDPNDPMNEKNEYRRRRVFVESIDRKTSELVWVYEMVIEKIRDLGGVRVESGNWRV